MRGQAETLGFVFVFTLILLSVGLAAAIGLPGLQDLREDERTNNVERAFDVLSTNVEDIYRRGAPGRATEMKLAGGRLVVGNSTELNVSVRNTADAAENATFRMTARPLVYDDGDGTEIAYEHGATMRTERGGTVLLSDPRWLVDDRRIVVPFVTARQDGERRSIGGSTVRIATRRRSERLRGAFTTGTAPGDPDVNVTVTVTSPRAAAWQTYLVERGFTAVDDVPGDGAVIYVRHTDAVYVPETVVDVELTR
jgi:hypothetical protein